mmetsp:Transcript_45367/g.96514  ORF Transcript_45367/g.96514 Transcript_45367/m.96514 type:complete len:292 (-) Transcript_45367:98-973(-)
MTPSSTRRPAPGFPTGRLRACRRHPASRSRKWNAALAILWMEGRRRACAESWGCWRRVTHSVTSWAALRCTCGLPGCWPQARHRQWSARMPAKSSWAAVLRSASRRGSASPSRGPWPSRRHSSSPCTPLLIQPSSRTSTSTSTSSSPFSCLLLSSRSCASPPPRRSWGSFALAGRYLLQHTRSLSSSSGSTSTWSYTLWRACRHPWSVYWRFGASCTWRCARGWYGSKSINTQSTTWHGRICSRSLSMCCLCATMLVGPFRLPGISLGLLSRHGGEQSVQLREQDGLDASI